MALVRYQPTSFLQQFNNEINRMFLRDADASSVRPNNQWAPAVDIRETENAYEIQADVPGIDPKTIEINLEKGVLSLEGERVETSEGDDGKAHYVERHHGRFVRRFSLPDTADEDSIQATADQGVLRLVINKKTKSQPRRIAVQG